MTPQELKTSILQLAIQGKLVEQRPEEGTGEQLYASIVFNEKKTLKTVLDDEIPFDIPSTWKWLRHNELFEIVGGSQPAKSKFEDTPKEGYVRLYQIRDYGEKPVPVYVPKNLVSKFTEKGDILLARYGASVGKVFWAEQGAYNVAMAKSTPLYNGQPILPEYLYYYYLAPLYQILVKNNSRSAQAGFNKDDLNELLFPLPPLAEQNRIVAKIEELLPLIDCYEQAWSKLEDFNKRFPVDMQKSILQMAIQGKLVPQLPEEGTGEELFLQIQAEKQRLIKKGIIKKEKPLPEIAEDEIPFDIPEGWTWVRFGNISDIIGTGLVRSNSEQYVQAQYHYFKMNNIGNFDGKCHFDSMNMVNATPEEYERYKIEKGDFLFNTRNSRELVGKTAVVPEINLPIILNNNILKIRFLGGIIPEYINCFFNSPLGREQLVKFITNTTNVAAIYQKQLITLHVPLPPVAEQKRIVAKLEKILPLCERLK